MSNAILFDSGSTEVKQTGRRRWKRRTCGRVGPGLRVEGHTDDDPVRAGAAYPDNWALSFPDGTDHPHRQRRATGKHRRRRVRRAPTQWPTTTRRSQGRKSDEIAWSHDWSDAERRLTGTRAGILRMTAAILLFALAWPPSPPRSHRTPASGPAGTAVTVTGSNFVEGTTARCGQTLGDLSIASPTELGPSDP